MNLKKLISGAAVSTLAVAGFVSASSFNDVAGHWVETGGFLDTAITEGAIDGTKPSFRPNDSITRAELTKMVTVYDNGGDEPTSMDYLSDAGFTDNTSGAWYYNVVNYAAEEGIVGGYTDGTFRPNQAITRAEAVKVITLALEVPSVDVTMPFADVSSNDWFYPYVKNAYGNCVVNGRSASMFEPASPITRAESVKVFVNSINPGCTTTPATTEPTATATAEPTATPDGYVPTATPMVTTDATSEVVLSTRTPAAQSVPTNAYQVPFLAIDITASNDEDLLLTGVAVQHTGLGDADEIKNVQVFEGVIPRGNDKNFSGEDDVASLNLNSDPVVIPAGTTKTVYIRADLQAGNSTGSGATAGGEHAMAILSSGGVTLVGADTGAMVPTVGTFPIVGSTMTVANIEVGSVDVTLESIADTEVESGSTDVELARIKMDAGSQEDVYVRALTIELDGTLDDGDVENLYIEVDGVMVSNVVASTMNDFATFDLTTVNAAGILITDGSTEYFTVMGDLTGPIDDFSASNTDVIVGIDSSSDIVVVGAKYGFGVEKTLGDDSSSDTIADASTTLRYIDIIGGDIKFSEESTKTDIADDTQNVYFGSIIAENFSGEAVEISDALKINLFVNEFGKTADLENIKLVNRANGSTVLGSVDGSFDTLDTDEILDLGEDFIIASGQKMTLDIYADVVDGASADAEYFFQLDMSTIEATGQASDSTGFDIKPTSDIQTSVYTIKEAGLTVTSNSLEDNTYVEGTTDVVWEGSLRANNVKDVKVDRLTFTNTGSASTSEVDEYSLQANVDGVWMDVETSLSSANTGVAFSFTDLNELTSGDLIVEAGEEVEIRVLAKVSDTVSASNTTIKLVLDADDSMTQEIEADGSTGDDLGFITTGDVPANTADVPVFTIVDNGSLTVTLDTAKTPDSALLVAGTTGNEVAVYEFDAQDENVEVDALTIKIGEVAQTFTANPTVESSAAVAQTVAASTEHENDRVTIALTSTETGVGTKFQVRFDMDGGTTYTGSYIYEVTGAETGGIAGIASAFAATIDADALVSATATGNIITVERAGTDTDTADTMTLDTTNLTTTSVSKLAFSTDGGTVWADSAATVDDTLVDGNTDTGETSTLTVSGTVQSTDLFTVTVDGTALAPVAGNGASTASDIAAAINAAALSTQAGTGTEAMAITASASGEVVTVISTDTASNGNLAPFDISVAITPDTSSAPSSDVMNDADAIKSVSLYDGATLLKTVTGLDANNEAYFTGLNWIVDAGTEKYLSVRVTLKDIDYGVTNATALSGHTIDATLVLDGVNIQGDDKSIITGYESSEDLVVGTGVTYVEAGSDDFIVTNNKIVAAKLTADTTVGNGTKELIKFSLTDSGDSASEAGLATLVFNVALSDPNALGMTVTNYTVPGTDAVCVDAAGTVTCTFTDEPIGTSSTYVLEGDVALSDSDASVTTTLKINSAAVNTTDGVTWTDGENGGNTASTGVQVTWIDLGEADESTSRIQNTLQ